VRPQYHGKGIAYCLNEQSKDECSPAGESHPQLIQRLAQSTSKDADDSRQEIIEEYGLVDRDSLDPNHRPVDHVQAGAGKT
jgi:hypothetical protein